MRKRNVYVISTQNRDHGKKFRITEMPAASAERWASQVLEALFGKEMREDLLIGGLMSLSALGLASVYQIADIDKQSSLADRLLNCVEAENEDGSSWREFDQDRDVEEVSTLSLLRSEVFNLHVSFFGSRKPLDVGGGHPAGDFRGYPNVPPTLGGVISSGLATLAELDTVYGVEDLYDLLEVAVIDAHNQREAMRQR